MTVPAKVVKFVGLWHSSQATFSVEPLGGLEGMCPVAPEGGCFSVGGAMLANVRP